MLCFHLPQGATTFKANSFPGQKEPEPDGAVGIDAVRVDTDNVMHNAELKLWKEPAGPDRCVCNFVMFESTIRSQGGFCHSSGTT